MPTALPKTHMPLFENGIIVTTACRRGLKDSIYTTTRELFLQTLHDASTIKPHRLCARCAYICNKEFTAK